ncbi:MAG TPA: DsrE family protein [Nitrospiraceae bacterium]|jgi:peroxiredoxin family protein|nr:DsrE family protein [Nitrospiraceae bacterium]
MKKLAVIVTRGTFNNLLQACDLVRIAAANGTRVSVLFRDEAAARLTHDKVKQLPFSEGYRGREARVRELLRERKRDDLPAVLRGIKELGDVKWSVCRDSLDYFELGVEQLIPELDEVQTAEAFWKEEVAQADAIMTF